MARPAGLEPTTPWFVESSTKCLYSRCFWRVRCATNVHPCPRAFNKVAQKSRMDYLPLWPHLAISDALATAQYQESTDSDRITNVRECEDSCPPRGTGGSGSEHAQQQEEPRINSPWLSYVILLHHQLLTASAHLRHRSRMQCNAGVRKTTQLHFRIHLQPPFFR
jgi:hypothetical protein